MDSLINDFRTEKFNQLTTMNATALALMNSSPDQNKTSPDATNRSGFGSIEDDRDEREKSGTIGGGGGSGLGKRPFHLQFSDIEPRF